MELVDILTASSIMEVLEIDDELGESIMSWLVDTVLGLLSIVSTTLTEAS